MLTEKHNSLDSRDSKYFVKLIFSKFYKPGRFLLFRPKEHNYY